MKKEFEDDKKVSYDAFASTFSKSRIGKKWPEVDYCVEKARGELGREDFSVLDIGCGNGRLLESLKNQGWAGQYLGIDASVNMLQEAQKIYPQCRFLALDMLDISEIKESFDAIFFIASFHHLSTIQDRVKVLFEVKKKLNEGGVIFFINWNLYSEENTKKYAKNQTSPQEFQIKIGEYARYYHGFMQEELQMLFLEGGFTIKENREFEG